MVLLPTSIRKKISRSLTTKMQQIKRMAMTLTKVVRTRLMKKMSMSRKRIIVGMPPINS